MTRSRWAPAALVLSLVACDELPSTPTEGDPDSAAEDDPAPTLFATPIAGEMNRDWFMTNYVDGSESYGIDYECGPKSYLGHKGTDLVLPDFARMDQGLEVIAAGPGTVIGTHDGEYDRNKTWLDTVTWNVVTVDHGEHGGARYVAYYGHLKSGSVAVAVGGEVSAGTVLGQVGSSGRSDMPHLHFEVRRAPADGGTTEVADPWEGPCGAASSLWISQLPYQNAFRVIQAGVATGDMSLDRVKDPPTSPGTVTGGEAGTVSAWIQLHNQEAGAATNWLWRRPDGSTFANFRFNHDTFYSMSWWWGTVPTASLDAAGTWSVEITTHGDAAATLTFEVELAAAVAPVGDREVTVGGGGLR